MTDWEPVFLIIGIAAPLFIGSDSNQFAFIYMCCLLK